MQRDVILNRYGEILKYSIDVKAVDNLILFVVELQDALIIQIHGIEPPTPKGAGFLLHRSP